MPGEICRVRAARQVHANDATVATADHTQALQLLLNSDRFIVCIAIKQDHERAVWKVMLDKHQLVSAGKVAP